MARVAVIGGGYGGVTVAKGLDPLADVILIEQKDQFVHHAAALRAAVDTVWEHAIFMPYTNLLSHGQVVRGTVSAVHGTTVHVFGHDPIEADYVVFATGSTYPFPAKYSSYRSSVAKARLEQLHENLSRARSVMIVGGGTVGIELTGELANAFPGLDITIVEASDQILAPPATPTPCAMRSASSWPPSAFASSPAPSWPTCPLRTSATSRTSWSKPRMARSSRPISGSSATAHAPTPGS